MTFRFKRDAEAYERKMKGEQEEIRRGLRGAPAPRKSFEELCSYWITNRASQKRSGFQDESIIRAHLRPAFGALMLHEIGVVQLDTCARIEDRQGMSIWSLDVVGEAVIDKLRATRGRFAEFLGIVIALPTALDAKRPDAALGARDFLLHVVDVRSSASAFDLLAAPADERARARELLLDLRRQNLSPLKSITSTLIERLQIAGLDKVPILRDLIEFAVLQAVSDGWISHAPAKLHLLLIGPPARGKKLLQLVAQVLNPVAGTLSSARASPAGWVGASSHHDGRWTSAPGVLPRASGGVALLQDAHAISAAELRKLVHILAEVIEDGRVRSSVVGGTEWDSRCREPSRLAARDPRPVAESTHRPR